MLHSTNTHALPSDTDTMPSRNAECVSTWAAMPTFGLERDQRAAGHTRRVRIVIYCELVQRNVQRCFFE